MPFGAEPVQAITPAMQLEKEAGGFTIGPRWALVVNLVELGEALEVWGPLVKWGQFLGLPGLPWV